MRTYPLKLDEYGLSRWEYEELKAFCRQYHDKKERLKIIASGSGKRLSDMPRGTDVSNPTLAAMIKREPLLIDCELIEQAAIEAWPEEYQALLQNITLGIPYERVLISDERGRGRTQFFDRRRKFFYILWLKRQKTEPGGNA